MDSCSPQRVHGGKRGGETLTLRTDGPLPAFFADTREGLAVDHTGAPIVAGVRQAATVSGYEIRADRTTLPEDPATVWRGRNQVPGNRHRLTGPRPLRSPGRAERYLCYRSFLPSLRDTCT